MPDAPTFLETGRPPLTPDAFEFEAGGLGRFISFASFLAQCHNLGADPALPRIAAEATLIDILGTPDPQTGAKHVNNEVRERLNMALKGQMPGLKITRTNLDQSLKILESFDPQNKKDLAELTKPRRAIEPLWKNTKPQ